MCLCSPTSCAGSTRSGASFIECLRIAPEGSTALHRLGACLPEPIVASTFMYVAVETSNCTHRQRRFTRSATLSPDQAMLRVRVGGLNVFPGLHWGYMKKMTESPKAPLDLSYFGHTWTISEW